MVGYKEIYDELRGVTKSLTKLDGRMEKLEEKFETVNEANNRSRQAYEMAKENEREVAQLISRFKDYTREESKRRERQGKNIIGIIAIIVPVILAVSPILIQYYSP